MIGEIIRVSFAYKITNHLLIDKDMEARHGDEMYCFLLNSYEFFEVGCTMTSLSKFFQLYIIVQS